MFRVHLLMNTIITRQNLLATHGCSYLVFSLFLNAVSCNVCRFCCVQCPQEGVDLSDADRDVLRYCNMTYDLLPQPVISLPSD